MKSPKLHRLFAIALVSLPSALLAVDADMDGLDDAFETNTGTYVSPTNTGTSPAKADSDGDGAGDWYEVTACFTNPNIAASRPNVPYPLPAPDAGTGATDKPVKVFILSGQSNMEGQGNISPQGTPGTLETITKSEYKFPNLLNGANWSVRNDVRYRGVISAIKDELLTAGEGTGSTAIGPELGFGHVMGYYHGEPVLILKSSEGGKSLGGDFLPPGSVQYTYGSNTFPGFGQSPVSWVTGTTPVNDPAFYGGIQFDKCFRNEADWAPAGASLPAVTNVTDVLDNFAAQYPQWAAQGFEIAGFAWFQGWNDGLSYTGQYAYRYEQNMAQFIRQIRAYYEGRYPGKIKPKAPFAIATCAFDGYSTTYPTRVAVVNGQLAVANPTLYPEFAGNVITMDARNYWRDTPVSPVAQGYHYNRNSETFMLVGDALGRGMIDLLNSDSPDTTPPVASSFTPVDNATGVGTTANLTITFDEPVLRGSGNITLKNLSNSTQTVIPITDPQVSITDMVLTINPTADLATSTNYAVRVDATALVNLSGTAFPGIADDTTWNFTTAAPDLTPPTPNPMSFSVAPAAASTSSITMTATTAADPNNVQYYFDETSGVPGGTDSGWQDSPVYADTGLNANTPYSYRVKARDKSPNQNETAYSASSAATTQANLPGMVAAFDVNLNASPTEVGYQGLSNTTTGSNNGVGLSATAINFNNSGYRDRGTNAPLATATRQALMRDFIFWNSGSTATPATITFQLTGLTANTSYAITYFTYNQGSFQYQMSMYKDSIILANKLATHNSATIPLPDNCNFTFATTSSASGTLTLIAVGDDAGFSSVVFNGMSISSTPDATAPVPNPASFATPPSATGQTSITMTATIASDSSGVAYFFEETSGNPGGTSSGWQDLPTYTDTGLNPGTPYSYRVRTRDKSAAQNEGSFSTTASATTQAAGFSNWLSANGTTQTIDLDHDNDGVPNGIEYFLGGNTNTTGFTTLPGVSTVGGLSVTWTKHASYPITAVYGTDYVVETSPTLSGPWTAETVGGNVTITGNEVKFTFPTPLGTRNFARLSVSGP